MTKSATAVLSEDFQEFLIKNTELTQHERDELLWRRIAFRSFAFFILLIGVPLWWFTTTPLKAKLPNFDPSFVAELENLQVPRKSDEVWDSFQLHTDYNLHFTFIQDQFDGQRIISSQKIQKRFAAFGERYLRPIGIKTTISYEYLWDFSLFEFLGNSRIASQKSLAIDSAGQISAELASELDKLCSAPVDNRPLLKFAIFHTEREHLDSPIQLSHDGETTDGLAIASWGGIFINDEAKGEEALANSILGVLLLQLSISHPTKGQPVEEILQLHKRRLAIENMVQTVRILDSLYELAADIEDLVIPGVVAEHAIESKRELLAAYQDLINGEQINSESAARARFLAELANADPSLLELLNFPSDQKYGIYVPLFLPLLVPMLQPVGLFVFFLLGKLRKRKNEKSEGRKSQSAEDDDS